MYLLAISGVENTRFREFEKIRDMEGRTDPHIEMRGRIYKDFFYEATELNSQIFYHSFAQQSTTNAKSQKAMPFALNVSKLGFHKFLCRSPGDPHAQGPQEVPCSVFTDAGSYLRSAHRRDSFMLGRQDLGVDLSHVKPFLRCEIESDCFLSSVEATAEPDDALEIKTEWFRRMTLLVYHGSERGATHCTRG